tara:strand:+ start:225 stop:404 length:180 start_codon:yes stop_codon:yes gene_type:complete
MLLSNRGDLVRRIPICGRFIVSYGENHLVTRIRKNDFWGLDDCVELLRKGEGKFVLKRT